MTSISKIAFIASVSILVLIGLQRCGLKSEEKVSPQTKSLDSNYYVGSSKCQSCHASQYSDWQKSDHFLAMQEMTDSSALGDFNNREWNADGVKNRFLKKEGKFIMNLTGSDGANRDYEAKYAFGYFPLQQYLIATEGGRLQATRVSWDSRDKKWFHQYAGQTIHHSDWLHWTGNGQNWNTMCASCHSTNFKKNYSVESDTYASSYSEINVACESCHGAGAKHLVYIQSENYKNGGRINNAGFHYTKKENAPLQVNACAPCHARKTDLSQDVIQSDELLDDLIPELISKEHYFADGQINDEDYEYGSFTQSKMYHSNVKCSNCHNPHSGKLFKQGNELCLSCHKPEYANEKHHFHKSESEGAQCVNCHMVQKTYMGVDHRRDHSFRIPRPDQSVIYKTPNACNNCHTKQTATWAAETVKKWYGTKRAYHFSDDLLPGSLLNTTSESHLIHLLADTSQPEIARATAVYYLGDLGTASAVDALISYLKDKKALVRYEVLRALDNFPAHHWEQEAIIGLSDKVRAVRIAAADLYHHTKTESLPASAKRAYQAANAENRNYLRYQQDFAIGNVMMADYELQEADYKSAITDYLRGLKKDSMMNYARFNLSAAYNSLGKNQQALNVLNDAAIIDPKNDRAFYNLGLLYYEMNDLPATLTAFERAYRLGSENSSLYYNYGLALQEAGKMAETEKVFLKGYALNPNAKNLNYALSYFYLQKREQNKAKKYVTQLYHLDPYNKDYLSLYSQFGLK